MSKKINKSSDEILNELFDSLNLPVSPKSSVKKSHKESKPINKRSCKPEDDKNGCEDSNDNDLSSACSTDQEIDQLLEKIIDVPDHDINIKDKSTDSSKLKSGASTRRRERKESSSKSKRKKKSHKYNSSDSEDRRQNTSKPHSHSSEIQTREKHDKLLKSRSRSTSHHRSSRNRSRSKSYSRTSRTKHSSSKGRHYYSHSRSPSISRKNESHRPKRRRSSVSVSHSPSPRRHCKATKSRSKSHSPILKESKDPLDAWRTAKLATLKKNSSANISDSSAIKSDLTSSENEKDQLVIESIPLPVPTSVLDVKEPGAPSPNIIPLPCKESGNSQTSELDLQSIPVPLPGEDSSIVEGMNSAEDSSQRDADSANKNQDKVKDEGKNKTIVIKSLKGSLVLKQAEEEAQKKTKTESEDTNSSSDSKDTAVEQQTSKEENNSLEMIENSSGNTVSSTESKDNPPEKEMVEPKAVKEESGSRGSKSLKDKSHKRDKDKHSSRSEKKSKHKGRSRSRSRHKSRSRSKHRSRSRSKRRSRSRSRKSSKSKRKSRSRSKTRKRSRSGGRSKSKRKSRSRSRSRRKRSRSKERRRSRSRSKSRTRSKRSSKIARMPSFDKKENSPDCVDSLRDKATRKRLLEVARRNAVSQMRNTGTGISNYFPQPAVEAETFSSAGKSVQELTNFCQQLAAKDYSDTELSDPSLSPDESQDPEFGKPFSAPRHPFAVKDSKPILMNIRNAPMLPVKTNAERLADTSKLREQFPVSSGSDHRTVAEIGWVPVEKDDSKPKSEVTVFPEDTPTAKDISLLVSSRLSAMRKLQDNPTDRDAMTALNSAQKEMQNWALSKQKPGQFTGSTGARILSQEELSSGFQVWARKDQFRELNPVSSHFGLKMLQKMGWNPGEGLGKNKEGQLEPLVLDFKMDKKGLTAAEEMPSRKIPIPLAKSLAGKHPVSALVEICGKRRWNPPEFETVFDSGPDHKKNFLMKVHVNGQTYKPAIAASTKKIAKANAAAACLQALGLIPKSQTPVPQGTLSTTAAQPGVTLNTSSIPKPPGQPQGKLNATSVPPLPTQGQGTLNTTSVPQPPVPPQNANQTPAPGPPSALPPVPGEASNPPIPGKGNPTSQGAPRFPLGAPRGNQGPSPSKGRGKPVSYPTPMGAMYGGNPYGGGGPYNQMNFYGAGYQRPPY